MTDFYSIEDVISFAIRLEQASQEFYRRFSDHVLNPSVVKFFKVLLKEEQLHEAKLQELLNEQGVALHTSISAQEISGYIQAIEVPAGLDYKEAVKLAMEKEDASLMLYSALAASVEDPEVKSLFEALSREEAAHRQFFKKEYQRIQIAEN